jgi:hypothetical protein
MDVGLSHQGLGKPPGLGFSQGLGFLSTCRGQVFKPTLLFPAWEFSGTVLKYSSIQSQRSPVGNVCGLLCCLTCVLQGTAASIAFSGRHPLCKCMVTGASVPGSTCMAPRGNELCWLPTVVTGS